VFLLRKRNTYFSPRTSRKLSLADRESLVIDNVLANHEAISEEVWYGRSTSKGNPSATSRKNSEPAGSARGRPRQLANFPASKCLIFTLLSVDYLCFLATNCTYLGRHVSRSYRTFYSVLSPLSCSLWFMCGRYRKKLQPCLRRSPVTIRVRIAHSITPSKFLTAMARRPCRKAPRKQTVFSRLQMNMLRRMRMDLLLP
jgi:hypothetical protein